MSEEGKLYVCESCGQTTPVDNVACTNCGGKMVLFDDDMEPNPEDLDDEELDSDIGMKDDGEMGTQSLEALASQEQEESDAEYMQKSFNEDE